MKKSFVISLQAQFNKQDLFGCRSQMPSFHFLGSPAVEDCYAITEYESPKQNISSK